MTRAVPPTTSRRPPGLASALHRLRRRARAAVLARRRALAALSAGVAAALAVHALTAPPGPPARTVAVPVAARDLPAGARVGPGDVTLARFRPGSVPDGVVPLRSTRGATTAGPVLAGEPLTSVRLLGAGLLAEHPGTVAVPVRVGDAAVLRLLRPGDRVDVLAADPQRRADAVTVASAAPVLLVPPRSPEEVGPEGGGLLVVAVDGRTARRVAGHAVASYLSVVLLGRPAG